VPTVITAPELSQAYGFTVELRDTGRYGFVLPPDQIIPNGEEMVAAAMFYINYVVANQLPFSKSS